MLNGECKEVWYLWWQHLQNVLLWNKHFLAPLCSISSGYLILHSHVWTCKTEIDLNVQTVKICTFYSASAHDFFLTVWKRREVPRIERFTKWSGNRLAPSGASIQEYIVHRNILSKIFCAHGVLQERLLCREALIDFCNLYFCLQKYKYLHVFAFLFVLVLVFVHTGRGFEERLLCKEALKTFPP